jgi:spore germination protein
MNRLKIVILPAFEMPKTINIAAALMLFLTAASSAFAYRNSAWIPPSDANALTSLQANVGTLTESNPVWYGMNADASIAKVWNAENNTWRAAMTGSLLIPTLQNVVNNSFDGNLVATLLATPESREAHAGSIAQLVNANGYDGIDIDYERVPTTSRSCLSAFLGTLAQKLHASNKKLSVSVYAKTSDRDNWNGPGAEDWTAIGQVADSVKIMAYDFSYSTSAPGPIAPLEWLDQVAAYAQSSIPNPKIMMALPWYGYDWSRSTATTNMSYAKATLLAQSYGASIAHDANGEATFAYGDHTVYFQDATSYQKKVDFLKQRHGAIGGFAAWAAGVEDPSIWNIIRGSSSTPATQPLPADFSVAGPTSITVTPGSSISADYRVVPINGFSDATNVTIVSPAGFSGAITSASSVIAGGTATIRASANMNAVPGAYQVTVRFTSGTLTHDQVVNLTVTNAPRHRAINR